MKNATKKYSCLNVYYWNIALFLSTVPNFAKNETVVVVKSQDKTSNCLSRFLKSDIALMIYALTVLPPSGGVSDLVVTADNVVRIAMSVYWLTMTNGTSLPYGVQNACTNDTCIVYARQTSMGAAVYRHANDVCNIKTTSVILILFARGL